MLRRALGLFLAALGIAIAGTTEAAAAGAEVRESLPTLIKIRELLPAHTRDVGVLFHFSDTIGRVAWSSDGSEIAAVSGFGALVTVWKTSGDIIQELHRPGIGDMLSPIAFVAGNRRIVAASGCYGVPGAAVTCAIGFSVFDISNGTVVREVGGPAPDKGFPANTASSLVSSPDQTMLAVVNGNNPPHTVTLYDTANWKEIGDLPQASARSPFIPNQGLAFSHDGKVIAAVTTAGTITVYDVQTRQVIRSIRAFSYPGPIPHWVAFDPDAELVAAGSENILKRANEGYPKDTIRIFRTSDGAITATYAEPLPGLLRGMWSPAGAFLALLTRDGIYLWDPHQRKNAVRTTGVNDGVFDLQFSPDGSMLAVANGKSVTLFKVQP